MISTVSPPGFDLAAALRRRLPEWSSQRDAVGTTVLTDLSGVWQLSVAADGSVDVHRDGEHVGILRHVDQPRALVAYIEAHSEPLRPPSVLRLPAEYHAVKRERWGQR